MTDQLLRSVTWTSPIQFEACDILPRVRNAWYTEPPFFVANFKLLIFEIKLVFYSKTSFQK